MSPAELHDLIEEVSEKTVKETLEKLGFRTADPAQVQRDLAFLQDLRAAHDVVRKQGLLAILAILVASGIGLLWLGFRSKLGL